MPVTAVSTHHQDAACAIRQLNEFKEAGTHKSAKTHAGNVFVTHDLGEGTAVEPRSLPP